MSNISFNPLAWAIKPMYDKAIAEDSLFAQQVKEKEARAEKPKSLSECADYILGEAYEWAKEHKQGNVGYAGLPDDEVVNLIKHYYDEDDIVIKKVTGATASVSSTKEATKDVTKKDAGGKPKKGGKKKPERPKENLNCINVPMIRPSSEKEAKKASKEQAENVIVMDLFGGLSEEEDDLPPDNE